MYFDLKISELSSLVKSIQIDDLSALVKFAFEMSFTMIDGKVSNAILNVSSAQLCNVCLATLTHMNNIEDICQRPINDQSLLFGLSSLYAYIRCL